MVTPLSHLRAPKRTPAAACMAGESSAGSPRRWARSMGSESSPQNSLPPSVMVGTPKMPSAASASQAAIPGRFGTYASMSS